MIEILKNECHEYLVVFRIAGRLTQPEVHSAFREFHAKQSTPRSAKILGIYEAFDSIGMSFREAVEWHRCHFSDAKQFALVGDAQWLRALEHLQNSLTKRLVR